MCVGKKSYRTKHVFKSAKHGVEEVEMAMFKGFTTTTKKGKKIRKAKWLAYRLMEADENLSAKTVKKGIGKGLELSQVIAVPRKCEAGRRVPMPPIGLS